MKYMEIGLLEWWPILAPGPEREEADWTGLLWGSILSCFACWLLAKRKSSWRELAWQAEPEFCSLEAARTPALASERVLGLLRESLEAWGWGAGV